jgi:hypothetical protein
MSLTRGGPLIATRYLPAVAVMLALAIVPTVVHTYVGITASDGKTSAGVAQRLNDVQGVDTNRSALWVQEYYATQDFIERRYGPEVTLFVARSFDPKHVYHHPELGVAHGLPFDSASFVQVSAAFGSVPVRVLTGEHDLACYALLYDGRFIEEPLRFQVTQALTTLIGPRKQMTLFFAHGRASSTPIDSPVMRTLMAAIESFLAQPPAASR